MNGFYFYLHTNGHIIIKNEIVVDNEYDYFDSPFVVAYYHIGKSDSKYVLIDYLFKTYLHAEFKTMNVTINDIRVMFENAKIKNTDIMEYAQNKFKDTSLTSTINKRFEEFLKLVNKIE